MSIEVFNAQNPLHKDIAYQIGYVRYHGSIDRGIPLLEKPDLLIENYSKEATRSAQMFCLATFRDINQEILGFCVWRHRPESKKTILKDLYALPHSKDVLIGTPLVNLVKHEAIALGHKYIQLTASEDSIKSKFYQNRDFVMKNVNAPAPLNRQMIWTNPYYPTS